MATLFLSRQEVPYEKRRLTIPIAKNLMRLMWPMTFQRLCDESAMTLNDPSHLQVIPRAYKIQLPDACLLNLIFLISPDPLN